MTNNVEEEIQEPETTSMDIATGEEENPEQEGEAVEEASTSASKTIAKPKPANSKRAVSLPLSRIKQIMKMDPDVNMASSESVFLIAKCAEVFIEMLTKEAFTYTSSAKKKTIQKRDVDSAISNSEQLAFLDAALD